MKVTLTMRSGAKVHFRGVKKWDYAHKAGEITSMTVEYYKHYGFLSELIGIPNPRLTSIDLSSVNCVTITKRFFL